MQQENKDQREAFYASGGYVSNPATNRVGEQPCDFYDPIKPLRPSPDTKRMWSEVELKEFLLKVLR